MFLRQIIGYAPSLLIPALVAFGTVFSFTRLLTPTEYGHYTLAVNTMALLGMVFFYWLHISLPRLMPEAIRKRRDAQLRATTYVLFGVSALVLLTATGFFLGFVPLGDLFLVAWLAVPLALARSLLSLNEAVHRSLMDYKRYNFIECGQSILGFGIGLALVYFLDLGSLGAVLGLIIGMVIMALADLRVLRSMSWKDFDRGVLKNIIHFGAPLVFSYGLAFIIAISDRYIIEHYQGAEHVGIYAAGYILMDRISSILFLLIATPSYPLTMHKLEHEGIKAARDQTYKNGVAILMLTLPACAGLILVNRELAAVLIGDEFMEGALQVMPWIAVASLFNGLSTHYFDHAFHMAKKSTWMLYTQGPAALCNLILNFILIPRIGYMGAAYSTVISYALLLVLSIVVGRRAFAVRFPVKPALQIMASVVVMSFVVLVLPFPGGMTGLVGKVAVGLLAYGAAAYIFRVPYKILADMKPVTVQDQPEPLAP
ncbi:MAG: polysaccharide biosynthesis C-terminal domain-containing protein [Alphaproteobacteria bacterium]|nr:polysaccharide biosynthesis C-terminal domain-containing protein [Alphaproteobacteria bacterium]